MLALMITIMQLLANLLGADGCHIGQFDDSIVEIQKSI